MSHKRFRRVGRLRKGYHCRQVDAFLNHVEVSLGGVFPPPTASEVRQAGFELVHHGYVVAAGRRPPRRSSRSRSLVAQGMTSGRRGKADPDSEAAFLREQLAAPYMQRFPRAGMLHRGYHVDDVDEFVDRVVGQHWTGRARSRSRTCGRCRSGRKRGGYREDAVDEAMDRVIEHLLLVRRLGRTGTAAAAGHLTLGRLVGLARRAAAGRGCRDGRLPGDLPAQHRRPGRRSGPRRPAPSTGGPPPTTVLDGEQRRRSTAGSPTAS